MLADTTLVGPAVGSTARSIRTGTLLRSTGAGLAVLPASGPGLPGLELTPTAARPFAAVTIGTCQIVADACRGAARRGRRQVVQDRQRDQHADAVAKRAATPVDRLAGRATRHPQCGGDLLVAEPLQLAHHDRGALRIRKGA